MALFSLASVTTVTLSEEQFPLEICHKWTVQLKGFHCDIRVPHHQYRKQLIITHVY